MHLDSRGVFSEIFKNSHIKDPFKIAQVNYSFSKKGVLRGIHRAPYAKYVTCVQGEVYDVCVDLRTDSPTYKQYFGVVLDAKKLNSIFIPSFCGHAFIAAVDSIVLYQQGDIYNPDTDEAFCYKDFDIKWPINPEIISNKDKVSCLNNV